MGRHRAFTGVVCRERERKAAGVLVDEPRELADAAAYVLLRVERVVDVEARRGRRHELHQAQGALSADRRRVVIRLDPHQRVNQCRVEAVLPTDIGDKLPEEPTVETGA